jgi:hypothetical protein
VNHYGDVLVVLECYPPGNFPPDEVEGWPPELPGLLELTVE